MLQTFYQGADLVDEHFFALCYLMIRVLECQKYVIPDVANFFQDSTQNIVAMWNIGTIFWVLYWEKLDAFWLAYF